MPSRNKDKCYKTKTISRNIYIFNSPYVLVVWNSCVLRIQLFKEISLQFFHAKWMVQFSQLSKHFIYISLIAVIMCFFFNICLHAFFWPRDGKGDNSIL